MPFYNKTGTINGGGVGVALFFMLSGALMNYNYEAQFSYRNFYCKRFIRIYIPLWCSYIIFLTIGLIKKTEDYIYIPIQNYVNALLGLDFFANIGLGVCEIVGEWFTTVIIIIYVLFPLIRIVFKKWRVIGTIIIFMICFSNMYFQVLTFWEGWFSITNGVLYFWLGMLLDEYKTYWINKIIMIIAIILFICIILINPIAFLSIKYIPTFISSVLLFVILMQIKNVTNKPIAFISKYNYEIYLVHHRIFIWLIPVLMSAKKDIWNEFFLSCFLIGCVFICSIMVNILTKSLMSLIIIRKNQI